MDKPLVSHMIDKSLSTELGGVFGPSRIRRYAKCMRGSVRRIYRLTIASKSFKRVISLGIAIIKLGKPRKPLMIVHVGVKESPLND